MGIVLKNATLVDFDPPGVETGSLRIDGGNIVARGAEVPAQRGDQEVDCSGRVVLPGLVNGHAHLYSALACGMPPPPKSPRNFPEILEQVWWRLDRALDARSNELSGLIGALDAVRCGTTTLIDHHASPNCIALSLDQIEQGLTRVGLRGVLCYETTDRHGPAGARAGVAENRRYLERMRRQPSDRFAGLVGAHAAFTLENNTLDEMTALAAEYGVGVHIHVAEDPCDEQACRKQHGIALIQRLADHGVLRADSILAHCTHLDASAVARVNEVGAAVAHNPRSNMNNAVGYAPVAAFRCPVLLGTDGIGGDMLAEAGYAWFKSQDAHAGLSPAAVVAMMAASARRASAALGVTLGRLTVGAAADVVVTNHRPATPLTTANLLGHVLFSLSSRHVQDVMVGGRWVLRRHEIQTCDEAEARRSAAEAATALWKRMSALPA